MHDRRTRRGARAVALDAGRTRATLVRQALTLATLALTALATLGAAGCGGGARDATDEAPARSGAEASAGEVAGAPGAAGRRIDTAGLPGQAGSGTGAVGNVSGSVGTPGTGTLQDGDPSDAGVRSLLDAINAAETEASQLALQKGTRDEVKRYAQSMIAAHRQAPLDRGVEAQGSNSASDLLTPLEDAHRKTMQLLQSTPAGTAFDRAYVTGQVAAHEGALQALERAETAAGNATLVDRVRRTQTEVEGHLAEARRVQAVVSRNAP